jgi:c-di-GMP-binding flagellar brake protein YcgR
MPFKERRKHPRVPEAVSCQVTAGHASFATQTHNLSCGGVLCRLEKLLPLMTQLEIVLQLPSAVSQAPFSPIRCTGVVVRQAPCTQPQESGYLTAIFFSQLHIEDRRRIAEFVLQSMLAHDRRRS